VSTKRIIFEFSIAISFSLYIVIISILSPNPPFVNNYPIIGGIFSLIAWILAQSIFCRVRCLISTKLEKYGTKTLMISGCFTLLGEVVGGIFIYVLVDVFRLFKEKD
jgi:hypothetical protein